MGCERAAQPRTHRSSSRPGHSARRAAAAGPQPALGTAAGGRYVAGLRTDFLDRCQLAGADPHVQAPVDRRRAPGQRAGVCLLAARACGGAAVRHARARRPARLCGADLPNRGRCLATVRHLGGPRLDLDRACAQRPAVDPVDRHRGHRHWHVVGALRSVGDAVLRCARCHSAGDFLRTLDGRGAGAVSGVALGVDAPSQRRRARHAMVVASLCVGAGAVFVCRDRPVRSVHA